jgi:hypothetical protein
MEPATGCPELANVAASSTSHLSIDLTELVRDVFQRMGDPLLSFCLPGSGLGLAWVEVGLEELLDSIFHSALLLRRWPGKRAAVVRQDLAALFHTGSGFGRSGTGRANYTSSALVHEVNEALSFGRGEVEMPGRAVAAGDADREPARAGAESGLAFGKRWQSAALSEPTLSRLSDGPMKSVAWRSKHFAQRLEVHLDDVGEERQQYNDRQRHTQKPQNTSPSHAFHRYVVFLAYLTCQRTSEFRYKTNI